MQLSPHTLRKGGLSLLQGLVLLYVAGPAVADVNISGISGTLNQGASVNIKGSGFGTKSKAAPLLWDNFENGTLGSQLAGNNGWVNYRPSSPQADKPPYYSNAVTYGQGSKAARKDILSGENFKSAYWPHFSGAKEAYVSMYVYWNTLDNTNQSGAIMKFTRLNSNDVYTGKPGFGQTYQPGWFYEYYGCSSSITENQINARYQPTRGSWHRIEMYWKLGAWDGMAQTWLDLKQNLNHTSVQTQLPGTNNSVYSLLLPAESSQTQKPFRYYVDDVYIDSTRARVEIGNAPTWSDTTKRELQIPSEWSDSSITININKGSINDLQDAYLYVVDASGRVNETGYPLAGTAAPKPPTGLTVR